MDIVPTLSAKESPKETTTQAVGESEESSFTLEFKIISSTGEAVIAKSIPLRSRKERMQARDGIVQEILLRVLLGEEAKALLKVNCSMHY